MVEIAEYMMEQFHPNRFIVCEAVVIGPRKKVEGGKWRATGEGGKGGKMAAGHLTLLLLHQEQACVFWCPSTGDINMERIF